MSDLTDETIEKLRKSLEDFEINLLNSGSLVEAETARQEVLSDTTTTLLRAIGTISLVHLSKQPASNIGEYANSEEETGEQLTDEPKTEDSPLHIFDQNSSEGDEKLPAEAETEVAEDTFEVTEEFIEHELGESTEPIIQFPSLLDEIERFKSIHSHNYAPEISLDNELRKAQATEENMRTPEQVQLLDDIECIDKYCTYEQRGFTFVYTKEEIHVLAEAFRKFSTKNRPDFKGIEDEILSILGGSNSNHIKELIERATVDTPGRRGMQWDTLNNKAVQATNQILERSFERPNSKTKIDDRECYLIKVNNDPNIVNGKPDLTNVYQFIATSFAENTIISRSLQAEKFNIESFEKNVTIIRDYMVKVNELFESLPDDLFLEIEIKNSRGYATQTRKHKPHAYVKELVETMEKRFANGKEGSGATKGYLLNPSGALRLQYAIAHTINKINELLISNRGGEVTILPNLEED